MPHGQWLRSDTGVRWFFDAGAVSLDFAYLGGFGAEAGFGPGSGLPRSGAAEGLLVTADLDDWLGDRFGGFVTDASERDVVDARSLRDAIARLAVCAADGHTPAADDIDVVNLFAALPDVPPSLGGGRRQAGAARLRVSQALATLARDAVRVFDEVGFVGDPDRRLTRCAADDCRVIFYDESRAASRRWCSMQTCGNRAKVRAHRARAAAARTP